MLNVEAGNQYRHNSSIVFFVFMYNIAEKYVTDLNELLRA